jgi:hypothetical protein
VNAEFGRRPDLSFRELGCSQSLPSRGLLISSASSLCKLQIHVEDSLAKWGSWAALGHGDRRSRSIQPDVDVAASLHDLSR